MTDLLGVFDNATRCLRPWHTEVYDVLMSLASVHGGRGQHTQQLTRLRQALSVSHRRHMAFGDPLRVEVLIEILKAMTAHMVAGKASHDDVLALGRQMALYTGGFPVLHLCIALTLALRGHTASTVFHLGAYRRAGGGAIVHNTEEQCWLDRVTACLRDKGIPRSPR